MKIQRTIKYHWLKFRRLQGDPRKVALGAALGVFIGITPTIPFHTVLVLTLAPLLRVSVIAAYMGIWVSNPVTWVPQYLLAYEVGCHLLFPGAPLVIPEHANLSAYLDLIWRGGLALQVGGLVIALPGGHPHLFCHPVGGAALPPTAGHLRAQCPAHPRRTFCGISA